MPAVVWTLHNDRPCIEIVLPRAKRKTLRRLVADTGAGNRRAAFELLLTESDCLKAGGRLIGQAQLGGAYSGLFNVYSLIVEIPSQSFVDSVPTVGVANTPAGFDGIACFKFLNRFHYGNFGDPDKFGLE
jgi:hypothetical protein